MSPTYNISILTVAVVVTFTGLFPIGASDHSNSVDDHADYALFGTAEDPVTGDLLAGLIVCQGPQTASPLPVGIGGACDMDCGPDSGYGCVITVNDVVFNPPRWRAGKDTDGDGFMDVDCTGGWTVTGTSFSSPCAGIISVFIVQGSIGTITVTNAAPGQPPPCSQKTIHAQVFTEGEGWSTSLFQEVVFLYGCLGGPFVVEGSGSCSATNHATVECGSGSNSDGRTHWGEFVCVAPGCASDHLLQSWIWIENDGSFECTWYVSAPPPDVHDPCYEVF